MQRSIHFKKHGREVGAPDEIEYERMADAFMFGGMAPSTQQCKRQNNRDRLRFNYSFFHFGVACIVPEFVRTFYPVNRHKISLRGGASGYFGYECGRTDL